MRVILLLAIFVFLINIVYAQDSEKCYLALDIQETKTADVYNDAGELINQEIQFSLLGWKYTDGLYDSLVNIHDEEVPSDYILRVYDFDNNLIERYALYSSRFIYYDTFQQDNPGGIIELNESVIETIIPVNENIEKITIEYNNTETDLNIEVPYWGFECKITCKKENGKGYFGKDKCCLDLLPAKQDNAYDNSFVCTKCGDGICSNYESKYSCYEDCGKKIEVCPGDTNGDKKINILDLIFIRDRLNQDINIGDNKQADANNDGKIDILDLIFVRGKLNTKCGVGMSPVQNQWWKILVVLIVVGVIIFILLNKNRKRR